MKNYVQPGAAVTVPAPRDVKSGELLAVGALVGFCQTDAMEDQDVAIVTEGVFRVEVEAAADIEVGDVIYLDDQTLTAEADDGATPTPAAFPRAGVAVIGGAASDGVAEVHVKINA